MLSFFADDATQRLHNIVSQVKESPEVTDAYMMWEEKIFYERRDAKEEGREEGRKEGRKEGLIEERIRAIQKKLEKNKSLGQIADELEISIEEVKEYVSLIQG